MCSAWGAGLLQPLWLQSRGRRRDAGLRHAWNRVSLSRALRTVVGFSVAGADLERSLQVLPALWSRRWDFAFSDLRHVVSCSVLCLSAEISL